MKFDHYDGINNISYINHQVSQRGLYNPSGVASKSRESVKIRHRRRMGLTFVLILVEIVVIFLVAFYFISPLNRVSHVSVAGNQTILSNSVVTDMQANPGKSITGLISHQGTLKARTFSQNVQLRSIHFKIHHWNRVRINVKEYPIIAYLCINHKYFAVSNNGKRAYQATKPNQVDPLLFNFRSGTNLDSFIRSYRKISDSIKPDIEKIYYSPNKIDPDRIHVYMSDGNQIYANYKNWNRKMRYYSAISKSMKKKGVVNLELGAYSRPFNRSNHKR